MYDICYFFSVGKMALKRDQFFLVDTHEIDNVRSTFIWSTYWMVDKSRNWILWNRQCNLIACQLNFAALKKMQKQKDHIIAFMWLGFQTKHKTASQMPHEIQIHSSINQMSLMIWKNTPQCGFMHFLAMRSCNRTNHEFFAVIWLHGLPNCINCTSCKAPITTAYRPQSFKTA